MVRGEWRENAGERVIAFGLFVLALPLGAALALWILATSGRPVVHRGTRLGKDKRPFRMLKLRTLIVGAENVTGGDLLGNRHGLTIPGGRFLRDTRLDELPQLWNIVRGDMAFIGPRPERPEVLAQKCGGIAGYERRFEVRPGLIGIAQLFTPHGTPKRYRTLLDNGLVRRRARGLRRLRIVAITFLAVLRAVLRRAWLHVLLFRARAFGRQRERRRYNRVAPVGAVAHLRTSGAVHVRSSRVIDMNAETVRVACEAEPGLGIEAELVLEIPVLTRNRPARRTARCAGMVKERRGTPKGQHLLIHYTPSTPCSEYMIHQYFLGDSLALPRAAWRGPSSPTPAPHPAVAERRARARAPVA